MFRRKRPANGVDGVRVSQLHLRFSQPVRDPLVQVEVHGCGCVGFQSGNTFVSEGLRKKVSSVFGSDLPHCRGHGLAYGRGS